MELTSENVERFYNAYVECMVWADCPERHLKKGLGLHSDAMKIARADCLSFLEVNHDLIGDSIKEIEQAGHDFWLTRKGHGSGFWDSPEIYGEENSQKLTKASKSFNEHISLFFTQENGEYCLDFT